MINMKIQNHHANVFKSEIDKYENIFKFHVSELDIKIMMNIFCSPWKNEWLLQNILLRVK